MYLKGNGLKFGVCQRHFGLGWPPFFFERNPIRGAETLDECGVAMNSYDDKRDSPRIEIQLGILFKQGMEWYPADIKDLSSGGLTFETDREFQAGEQFHIYFSESRHVTSNELTGEAVRSERIDGSSPLKYLVAAKLVDANEQYLQDVLSIFQEGQSDSD